MRLLLWTAALAALVACAAKTAREDSVPAAPAAPIVTPAEPADPPAPAPAAAAPHAAIGDFGVDLAAGDHGVRPGDDFFAYANGKWYESFVIPADHSSFGPFNELEEISTEHVRSIIEAAAAAHPASGTPEQQIERAMSRDHLTREETLARMSRQMSLEEKVKFADYVIDTSGAKERTLAQTRVVYETLRSLSL